MLFYYNLDNAAKKFLKAPVNLYFSQNGTRTLANPVRSFFLASLPIIPKAQITCHCFLNKTLSLKPPFLCSLHSLLEIIGSLLSSWSLLTYAEKLISPAKRSSPPLIHIWAHLQHSDFRDITVLALISWSPHEVMSPWHASTGSYIPLQSLCPAQYSLHCSYLPGHYNSTVLRTLRERGTIILSPILQMEKSRQEESPLLLLYL